MSIVIIHGTMIAAGHCANDVFFGLPEALKKHFLGLQLGEKLQAMSSLEAVPKGPKWIEWERGVRGKNSPVCHIPEQGLLQDALT